MKLEQFYDEGAEAQPVKTATTLDPPDFEPTSGEAAAAGGMKSILDTYYGLRQLLSLAQSPEEQEQIRQQIAEMEATYEPAMKSTAGKLGYGAGVIGSLVAPGGIAGQVAKGAATLPRVAKTAGAVEKVLAPGTLQGQTALGAAQGAIMQPTPEAATPSEVISGRVTQAALGGASALVPSAVTSAAKKVIEPSVRALEPVRRGMTETLEHSGITLTPGQYTGSNVTRQFEEGLKSMMGSAGRFQRLGEANQGKINKMAMEAIGSTADRPSRKAFQEAWKASDQAYKDVVAQNPVWLDQGYRDSLKGMRKQYGDLLLTEPKAGKILKAYGERALPTKSGATRGLEANDFLNRLKQLRDAGQDAYSQGNTALGGFYRDMARNIEESAERSIQDPKVLQRFREARTKKAIQYDIEASSDIANQTFDPMKFSRLERKQFSPHGARRSAAKDLAETSEAAAVTRPYIGSSGTAERGEGQQMVRSLYGPLALGIAGGTTGYGLTQDPSTAAAWTGAGLLFPNLFGKAYLSNAMRRNLLKGASPVNKFTEKLTPGMAAKVGIGAGRAAQE